MFFARFGEMINGALDELCESRGMTDDGSARMDTLEGAVVGGDAIVVEEGGVRWRCASEDGDGGVVAGGLDG